MCRQVNDLSLGSTFKRSEVDFIGGKSGRKTALVEMKKSHRVGRDFLRKTQLNSKRRALANSLQPEKLLYYFSN
ncbi:hypothetical protein [Larkinella ripae]